LEIQEKKRKGEGKDSAAAREKGTRKGVAAKEGGERKEEREGYSPKSLKKGSLSIFMSFRQKKRNMELRRAAAS